MLIKLRNNFTQKPKNHYKIKQSFLALAKIGDLMNFRFVLHKINFIFVQNMHRVHPLTELI